MLLDDNSKKEPSDPEEKFFVAKHLKADVTAGAQHCIFNSVVLSWFA